MPLYCQDSFSKAPVSLGKSADRNKNCISIQIMKTYLMLICLILCLGLYGEPIVETMINQEVWHASFSDTRMITCYPYDTSYASGLTHITIWDITNPGYPQAGDTFSMSSYIYYKILADPLVWGNYLIFLEGRYVQIYDITNIHNPVQIGQIWVSQTYCITMFKNYLVLGNGDGSIDLWNIANTAAPQHLSTSNTLASIWDMWVAGDKLAVRCGHSQYNTAKLMSFNEDDKSFTEVVSVTEDCVIDYVSEIQGKLIYRAADAYVRLYDYDQSGANLVSEFSPAYHMNSILTDGNILLGYGANKQVQIWRLDPENNLHKIGHYDLSHSSFQSGLLFELRDGRLLFSFSTLICAIMDVSNLSPPPHLLSTYCDGTEIANIYIPTGQNNAYFTSDGQLKWMQISSSGELTAGGSIPNQGSTRTCRGYAQNLYTISIEGDDTWLSTINVENPLDPIVIDRIPVDYANVFIVKGRKLFLGSNLEVTCYDLPENGAPIPGTVYSYHDSDYGYDILFLDFYVADGGVYSIGLGGSALWGYYPIMVYWLRDGTVGKMYPSSIMDMIDGTGDYLYVLGNGYSILELDHGVPRPRHTMFSDIMHKGCLCSIKYRHSHLIQSYEMSNQIHVVSLDNPLIPEEVFSIHQPHGSLDLAIYNDMLLSADGIFGISVHSLGTTLDLPIEVPPAQVAMNAYPNPFRDVVNISWDAEKSAPATIECFNIRGQLVYKKELGDLKAGHQDLIWDGKDDRGGDCASGIYILRIRTPHQSLQKTITKIK